MHKRSSKKKKLDHNKGKEFTLLFYSYLNDKDDDFLESHYYSREEIKEGLKSVVSNYKLGSLVEIFLME
ncbi:DUF6483 family protein [Lachnospiraceae bacterium OttesenSCG-928-D06]|nr:DUF6483 family protein [Lachnospiraceae bacterium OttesenSCG-928-D06]